MPILFCRTYRVTRLAGAVALRVASGGVDVSLSYQADLSVAVIVVAGSLCAPL